tara:strand:- start:61 stop:204 length:144 start_codon:yes stop_codon:yes gene_type:complete
VLEFHFKETVDSLKGAIDAVKIPEIWIGTLYYYERYLIITTSSGPVP